MPKAYLKCVKVRPYLGVVFAFTNVCVQAVMCAHSYSSLKVVVRVTGARSAAGGVRGECVSLIECVYERLCLQQMDAK